MRALAGADRADRALYINGEIVAIGEFQLGPSPALVKSFFSLSRCWTVSCSFSFGGIRCLVQIEMRRLTPFSPPSSFVSLFVVYYYFDLHFIRHRRHISIRSSTNPFSFVHLCQYAFQHYFCPCTRGCRSCVQCAYSRFNVRPHS